MLPIPLNKNHKLFYASATEGGAGGIMWVVRPYVRPYVRPVWPLSQYLKNHLRFKLKTRE